MKKITLLSLAAAAVLFTACGEDMKKAASDAATKTTEAVKDTASNAVDATKEAASNAVDATKEAASNAVDATKEAAASAAQAAADKAVEAKEAAEQKAAEAAEALKERAAAATEAAKEKASEAVTATKEAVADATSTGSNDLIEKGKQLFAKCAGCHGPDGKTKALGKSGPIAGLPAEEVEKILKEYKAGTRNVYGMGMLMKGQVASLSDEDIKALAAYISSLK